MSKNQVVMTIISVQICEEKCHDIKFLRDIAFSRPLFDGDVKFCLRIR
jgi:hypothetical protein